MTEEARLSPSPEDVRRWEDGARRGLDVVGKRIVRGDIDNGLCLLSLIGLHRTMALVSVARQRFGQARGHYAVQLRLTTEMFRIALNGRKVHHELLVETPKQTLFAGFISGHAPTLQEFFLVFHEGLIRMKLPPSSVLALMHLFEGNHEAVRGLLAKKRSVWSGGEEVRRGFEAIVAHDDSSLQSAIRDLDAVWRRTVKSEALRGLPDSLICEASAALAAIAASVWKRRPQVETPFAPAKLWLEGEVERVDGW